MRVPAVRWFKKKSAVGQGLVETPGLVRSLTRMLAKGSNQGMHSSSALVMCTWWAWGTV